MYIENRFYNTLLPNGSEENIYVVPDGKTLYIEELNGDGAFISQAFVCIMWDGIIIFSTHGSSSQASNLELVGDGIKSIKIINDNKSPDTQTIGAFWKGRLL